MITYWTDDDYAGVDWELSRHERRFCVVSSDRFKYERTIIAKCDTRDEAELVQDIKRAKNGDRHQTNPIETDWEIWYRGDREA